MAGNARPSDEPDTAGHSAGPGSPTNGMARLAADADGSAVAARGGSGPGGHGETKEENPVLPDDSGQRVPQDLRWRRSPRAW